MNANPSFWRGISAGLFLSAAICAINIPKKKPPLKTHLGRTMRQFGDTMDNAIHDLSKSLQ